MPRARPLIAPNLAPCAVKGHARTRRAMIAAQQLTVLGIPSVIPVCSLVPGCPVVAAGPRAPARRLSAADRGRKGGDAI